MSILRIDYQEHYRSKEDRFGQKVWILMNLSWIIAKRDLKSFFFSPVAYILLSVQGAFLGTVLYFDMSLGNLSSWFAILMLLVCPAITMRAISEEKKTKSIVLLFTLRSEEHTSELQSHWYISYAVFCLKKKKKNKI